VFVDDFADVGKHGVGLSVAVDFDDIGFREVSAQEVGFAMIVLQVLFNLRRGLSLKALAYDGIGHFQLHDQRLAESFLPENLLQEVAVILGGRITVQQESLADIRFLQPFPKQS